jgi:hypothetical protein
MGTNFLLVVSFFFGVFVDSLSFFLFDADAHCVDVCCVLLGCAVGKGTCKISSLVSKVKSLQLK